MKYFVHSHYNKTLKFIAASSLILPLSGCIVAVPPALQLASFVIDGVSFATTGKTVTDHAISGLTAQDCAMSRLLDGADICSALPTVVAHQPDGTVAPQADDVAKTITTAQDDVDFQKALSALENGEGDSLDQSIIDGFYMEVADGPTL